MHPKRNETGRWPTLVLAVLATSGCLGMAVDRTQRALAVEGPGALKALVDDGTLAFIAQRNEYTLYDFFGAEVCAERYQRAELLARSLTPVEVQRAVARLLVERCPGGVAVARPLRGWLAGHPLEFSEPSGIARLCEADLLPPCGPLCPPPGHEDTVDQRPITVRCAAQLVSGEVLVATSEGQVYPAESLPRFGQGLAQRLAAAGVRAGLPEWVHGYLPPADAPQRLAALAGPERQRVLATLRARLHADDVDPEVLPPVQAYFLAVRRLLLKNLLTYDSARSVAHYAALRRAYALATPLPQRLAALRAADALPSDPVQFDGALSDGNEALARVIASQVAALHARASRSGLARTTREAAWLGALLTNPLGFEPALVRLVRDTDDKARVSGLGRYALPVLGLSVDVDDAARDEARAALRVRLVSTDVNVGSETRRGKTLQVRALTPEEQARANEAYARRHALLAELASLDEAPEATSGGVGAAASGVTDYRCDRQGNNCRAVRQGGGESASSYFHRQRTPAVAAATRRSRAEVAAELDALPLPTTGAYETVATSQIWHAGVATLRWEFLRPDGSRVERSAKSSLQTKQGAYGVGVGLTPDELRAQVLANVLLDLRKSVVDELASLSPPPGEVTREVPPIPEDEALERCLEGRAPRALLDCLGEVGGAARE